MWAYARMYVCVCMYRYICIYTYVYIFMVLWFLIDYQIITFGNQITYIKAETKGVVLVVEEPEVNQKQQAADPKGVVLVVEEPEENQKQQAAGPSWVYVTKLKNAGFKFVNIHSRALKAQLREIHKIENYTVVPESTENCDSN